MERQREFYHKCHRCVFRGMAADFALPPTNGTTRPELEVEIERMVAGPGSENGVAERPATGVIRGQVAIPESREAASDLG